MGDLMVGKQPFLTIVTRACQRPKMLSENIQSVLDQSCHDLEHLFLVDHTRRGIQAADRALNDQKGHVSGRYVYVLDDDCILLDPDFVQLVKEAVEDVPHGIPRLIMVKSRRPPGPPSNETIFPTKSVWAGRPVHGTTNALCYVTEASLWKRHIRQFGTHAWGGDWWTLQAILRTDPVVIWLDRIVAESRQLGRGQPTSFETSKGDWFGPVARKFNLEQVKGDVWRLSLWRV